MGFISDEALFWSQNEGKPILNSGLTKQLLTAVIKIPVLYSEVPDLLFGPEAGHIT
jgi:hypothetical protein